MNHGRDANRDDALISRVVDGEATPDELAAVDRDPRLRALVDDVERARAALRDVDAPTTAATDAAIAAALRAADPADLEPVDLAQRRDRRRRRIGAVVAVAAALLIGLPLLAIALTGSGNESSDTATSAAGSQDQSVQDAAPQTSGASPTVDLGVLDTEDQLRVAVASVQATESSAAAVHDEGIADRTPSTQSSRATAADCDDTSPPGALLVRGSAIWLGQPATVVVFADDPDVIVVLGSDCTVLALVDR